MDKLDEYQTELCLLNRDYYTDMAVLRKAMKDRDEKYETDRLELEKKYHTPLHPDRARVDDKSRA